MAMEMAMATLIGTFFLEQKIVRNRVKKNRLSFAETHVNIGLYGPTRSPPNPASPDAAG